LFGIQLPGNAEEQPGADDGMGSHLGALEASLVALQAQGRAAIEAQKNTYEKKLASQLRDNKKAERTNAQEAMEIRMMLNEIKLMRGHAKGLLDTNLRLREDVRIARENISMARGFISEVTKHATRMQEDTPELAESIDDLAREQRAARVNQVGAVDQSWGADSILLQFGAVLRTPSTAGPQDILQEMVLDLEGVQEKQRATEASLKALYDEELQQARARGEEEHRVKEKLDAMKATVLDTKEKVTMAVRSLEETMTVLKRTRASLFEYLNRIGEGSSPPSRRA